MSRDLATLRDHCRHMADPATPGPCLLCRRRHPTITDDDRALFATIADEIDAYLSPPQDEHPTLFPDDTNGAP